MLDIGIIPGFKLFVSRKNKNVENEVYIMKLKNKADMLAADIKRLFPFQKIAGILAGAAILSFGMYNIHQQTGITEGGVLGSILLLNHWFGLTPALLSPILDTFCYIFGYKYLGKDFIKTAIVSTVSFACFFRFWEQFPPMLPNLSSSPLAAALFGGLFVGIGCGLVIRQGGSSCGDDALALVISKLLGCKISKAYMATDFTILLLSLSYIPLQRIAYSLITVTISSLTIDFVQNVGKNRDGIVLNE